MSLTFQQIISNAKKLSERLSDHESTAEGLITEIQSVCNQIESMKQYQEEVDNLNAEAKHRPREQVFASIQQEKKYLKDIQAENKELKNTLQDHQNALEFIMSKYRQQTAALMKNPTTNNSTSTLLSLRAMHNSRYEYIIAKQAKKIEQMTAVMKAAVSLDDEDEMKYKDCTKLKKENEVLREILKISQEYNSIHSKSINEKKINDAPAEKEKTASTNEDNTEMVKYQDEYLVI